MKCLGAGPPCLQYALANVLCSSIFSGRLRSGVLTQHQPETCLTAPWACPQARTLFPDQALKNGQREA